MLTERDLTLMCWILEQRFMSESQLKRVFWKHTIDETRRVYRRLRKLRQAGYLKISDQSMFGERVYGVTWKGVRKLRACSLDEGLHEVLGTEFSSYKHDMVVTDIRIHFYEAGFREWISERILARRNDLRRLPDGVIYYEGKYLAIEYEATRKSAKRYKKIFLQYNLEKSIQKVLFVVKKKELIPKLFEMSKICRSKIHFVSQEDFFKGQFSLEDLWVSHEQLA